MKDINRSSILVKVLANEKISLVVQENLSTASFDLKNRIIRIPNYMFEDDDFNIMVSAHEVAHCIYTPYQGWIEFTKDIKGNSKIPDERKKYAQSCLNIIEDVRIDKLIQRKYPGLAKYYKRSVKFIVETDFFKIKERQRDIHKMSFVNRLCVYAKCDSRETLYSYGVKFSPEEQVYVDRIMALETWDEAVAISLEVLEKFDVKDDGVSWDDHDTEAEKGEGSSDSDEKQEMATPEGRFEIDEEFMEDGEGAGKDGNGDLSMGGVNGDQTHNLYDMWEKGISSKANVAKSHSYFNKEGTKILQEMKTFETVQFDNGRRKAPIEKVMELSKEYQKYVNMFAMKFNQRKRARELVNNFERDIGRIDPLKLHKYKFDDNIFVKHNIENYQKNHGFIFLIDCSSSMSDVFKTLTLQLFAFYKICERIDVPYVVYGYTDRYHERSKKGTTNFNTNLVYYKFMEKGDNKKDIYDNVAKLIGGDLQMGGTPTSDALLGLVPEIKRFRQTFTPDIMNLIVITDGSDGTGMQSNSLSFQGALYMNRISPRGVVDNNAAIYTLMREFYDVRVTHMDITTYVPKEFLSTEETTQFGREGFLSKKDFGGADNVLWMTEKLVASKSTKVIDNLVNILA